MKANPGGQIDPREIVGRDKLVARLWDVLQRQSLVLIAERRMGKTCVMKKMQSESPPGVLTFDRDLEGLRSPLEFVEGVFHDVEEHLSRMERTAVKARALLTHLGGADVPKLGRLPNVAATHWKALLTRILEDLADHQSGLVVLFWDEMPMMLKTIKDSSGEAVALEILDTLRSLRHKHTNLRMVYTGSIGLHNVIRSLKKSGNPDDPTNDMQTEDVPPLSRPDAIELVQKLFVGEGLQDADEATAAAIADSVDCIPYYVHHVVDQMKHRGTAIDPDSVRQLVAACLIEPQDPWHLQHYRERIDAYYDEADRPFMLAMLDVLATAQGPLTFGEVYQRVKAKVVTDDEERVRALLGLLKRDHYARPEPDGRVRFSFWLVKRWWGLSRGLTQ
jgi:hypothetical protein